MSQAGIINITSGSLPPDVPLQFTTDVDGPAVPVANNLDVLGGTVFENNENGIQTRGTGDVLGIELTNRAIGNTTTSDGLGQTRTIMTFAFSAPINAYNFDINIVGLRSSDSTGVGFKIFSCIISDGVTTTIANTPDKIVNKSAALAATDVNLVVVGTTVEVQVTGIAGSTILWRGNATYIQVL